MKDSSKETYKEEARDLLEDLGSYLLDLENQPDNSDLLAGIFRALHTIKGSGAMFGFDRVADFTHNVESVYDLVRNGKLPVTRKLIDATLAACDTIRRMIDGDSQQESDEAETEQISELFREMMGAEAGRDAVHPSAAIENASSEDAIYRIRFRPSKGICANGTDLLLLLSELNQLGICRSVAQTELIPVLEEIDPESCYTYWEIILRTSRGINAIKDVFIFVEDHCELQIDRIDEGIRDEDSEAYKKIGQILVERGDITKDELRRALISQQRIGEILIKSGALRAEKVQAALAEQAQLREVQRKKTESEQASSIRVAAEKLDGLVNLVGELVTVQSRLARLAGESGEAQLVQVSEEVERLVAELRDMTMSIRMVPIGTTFGTYRRLVRDLGRELHKEVVLVTEGGETELDKTVIERLNDPLVHMIRNCVDHGIEAPDVREAHGKPRQGTVTISAVHSGANVLIRIKDDGAGLDSAAIRATALEKRLISADSFPDERELYALIFSPGFSTAKSVTNVSGRGVGLDVVKRNIEALQGSLEIVSESGAGTTITLKIPLTLAIIEGLLVALGEDHFVLPLAAIEECVELQRRRNDEDRIQNMAAIRGELVPYLVLRELLQIDGSHPDIEQIVTASIDRRRVGFVVDRVIGQHQIVIKPLGRMYRNVDEVSGATILGDGRVALILDMPNLVKKAERMAAELDAVPARSRL